MIITYNNFCQKINEITQRNLCDLYVIFSAGYTEKEAQNNHYELELLEFNGNDLSHVWLNDWHEGQQYIDLYGVYTEDKIIEIIQSYNFDHGAL